MRVLEAVELCEQLGFPPLDLRDALSVAVTKRQMEGTGAARARRLLEKRVQSLKGSCIAQGPQPQDRGFFDRRVGVFQGVEQLRPVAPIGGVLQPFNGSHPLDRVLGVEPYDCGGGWFTVTSDNGFGG